MVLFGGIFTALLFPNLFIVVLRNFRQKSELAEWSFPITRFTSGVRKERAMVHSWELH